MISIITPTYNRGHLLPKMIKSVQDQTISDWELIIMDDGSTDNTRQMMEEIVGPKIRFYPSETSTGAGDKRNQGVEKAKGDFIIFLDSDDWVEPNWLELFNKKITTQKVTIVTCSSKKLNEAGEVIAIRRPEDLGKFFNGIELNFLAGSLLLPKFIFDEAGGYDTSLPAGQHTDLLIRLLPLFKKYDVHIEKIDDSLVNIIDHSGAKIRKNYEVVYLGNSMLMEKHKKLFQKFPSKHFDFLSVTAVAAFKTGRVLEGKKLIKNALKVKPLSYLAYVRFIISRIPALKRRIWLQK